MDVTVRVPRVADPPLGAARRSRAALSRPAGQHGWSSSTARSRVPAAIAVDLGSAFSRMWVGGSGVYVTPTALGSARRTAEIIRRGRIADPDALVTVLARLFDQHARSRPPIGTIVACSPVLATDAERLLQRRVITTAVRPARVVLVDGLRAAALGCGTATGASLMVDAGAQVTQVGVLDNGQVVAARQLEMGTRDLALGANPNLLAELIAGVVHRFRADRRAGPAVEAAWRRGTTVVGGGAGRDLVATLAARLGCPIRIAPNPHNAAVIGAGLAATAAAHTPVGTAARPLQGMLP